jgi:hypothetical protein
MNTAIDYTQRADQHRPADRSAIAIEAKRLHGAGLTARDIAAAFRIDLADAIALLNQPLPQRDEHQ